MINTDIWGLPENWNNFDNNTVTVIKQPSLIEGSDNYRTFWALTEANKLPLDSDIDTSMCISGMGSECPYSNINYYTVQSGSVVSDTQTRTLTNWFFYDCSRKSAYALQNYITYLYSDNHYGQYRNFENTLSEEYNGHRYMSPFIDYDIKKFVLLIRVECSSSATGTQYYYDLDEYLTTYYSTYPYVFRVYARLYCNTQVSPLRRIYIHQGAIEGSAYCTTGICENYETTLVSTNKRVYCNHISSARGCNIPVWGCSIDKNNSYFPCSSYDEHGLIGIVYGDSADFETTVQNGNLYVYHHVTNIATFAEKARRAAAAFGCYFTGTENTAEYGSLTDNTMYIGVLDANLIAHGDYLQGTNTANAVQNEWTTVRDSTYDPNVETDKTKYQNDTQFYDSALANGFTRFWVLGSSGVSQLLAELYNIMNEVDPDEPIERYSQQVFLTNNPIDCVVSLKKFPLQNVPSLSGAYFVQLGSKTTSIQAFPLAKSCEVYYFTFSNATNTGLYPHFNKNFLDYEPYTTAKITIPFCGTVQVPATYFYDYGGVTVALVIDFISGACTGYIMANGITIDSVSGNCAITLPLSGIQSATLDSQIHSVAMAREKQQTTLGTGLIAGAVAIGVGIATGGVATAIGGAAAVIGSFMHAEDTGQQINYELSHMQTPLKQVAAASGQIAHAYDMRCKLLVTRPKILPGFGDEQQEAYANTIGFACLISSKVQDLHGFTVGTIDLDGVNCTAAEKEMIKNAFARGVYLK